MLRLTVDIKSKTDDDLLLALQEIIHLIRQGYTSSIDIPFEITGEEEDELREEEEKEEEETDDDQ